MNSHDMPLGYSECLKSGLTESMLLSHSLQHPLPEVSVITNGLILDLVKFKNEHHGITYQVFYQWVEEIYGEKWPYPESPTCEAIVRCIERLTAKVIKIKKQHS